MTVRHALGFAAALALAAVLAVPWGPTGVAFGAIYLGVCLIVLVQGWAAVSRHRNRWSWIGIFAGVTCWIAADIAMNLTPDVGPQAAGAVTALSELGCLAGYALFGTGLVLLTRPHRLARELPALLDAAIVAAGAAVPIAALVVLPHWSSESPARLVLPLVYCTADVFFATLVARLGYLRPRTNPVLLMLIVALCMWTAAGLAETMLHPSSPDHWGRAIAGACLVSYPLCLLAAGLKPASAHQEIPRLETGSRRRLMPLVVGLCLPLTALAIPGPGTPPWALVAGGLALVGALILVRLDSLLRHAHAQADQLDKLARRDPLTAVANRRSWDHELSRAVEHARDTGDSLCVAIIDLDRFKAYNDAYGHQLGDQLLQESTQAWLSRLDPTAFLARIGGEEFGLLLPGSDVVQAHARLTTMLAATPRAQTCSAGLAAWTPGSTHLSLVADADHALYRAKRNGRDQVCVAEAGSGLRPDVESEPTLVLQPLLDADSLQPRGFEVLSRFANRHHPGSIFALAHRNGRGDLLEATVVSMAAALARNTAQPLYVNVSVAALTSSRFLDNVPGDLTGLVLEFAETSRPLDWNSHTAQVDALRRRGARISVDDVGVGSTDLMRALAVRADVIKLDRALVTGCSQDPSRLRLLAALVELGHSVGSLVVAKGVETHDDLLSVRALGVDHVQGFLLGQPEAADCLDEHTGRVHRRARRLLDTLDLRTPQSHPAGPA
ncbi:MAG: EAL domain-containing protein [Actinomycetales bacterium]